MCACVREGDGSLVGITKPGTLMEMTSLIIHSTRCGLLIVREKYTKEYNGLNRNKIRCVYV